MNAFNFGCWYNAVNNLISSDLTLAIFRIGMSFLEGAYFFLQCIL